MNSLKVFLSTSHPIPNYNHRWPYLDVFLYDLAPAPDNTTIMFRELDVHGFPKPDGVSLDSGIAAGQRPEFSSEHVFPLRRYFFGGGFFLGPKRELAERRYDLGACVAPGWNHRLERYPTRDGALAPEFLSGCSKHVL